MLKVAQMLIGAGAMRLENIIEDDESIGFGELQI